MIMLARLVSLAALVATILPPIFLMAGWLGEGAMKTWMFAAAVAWFAATPVWMDRDTGGQRSEM